MPSRSGAAPPIGRIATSLGALRPGNRTHGATDGPTRFTAYPQQSPRGKTAGGFRGPRALQERKLTRRTSRGLSAPSELIRTEATTMPEHKLRSGHTPLRLGHVLYPLADHPNRLITCFQLGRRSSRTAATAAFPVGLREPRREIPSVYTPIPPWRNATCLKPTVHRLHPFPIRPRSPGAKLHHPIEACRRTTRRLHGVLTVTG